MGLAMNLGDELCCKAITFNQMLGILSYNVFIINSAFIEIILDRRKQIVTFNICVYYNILKIR